MAKSGVDWVDIESRYRIGESPNAIARDHDVSRQAIQKRAGKEGWVRIGRPVTGSARPETQTQAVRAALPTKPRGRIAADRTTRQDVEIPAGLDKAKAVEAVANGATQAVLAAFLGVTQNQLIAWLESEPEIARQVAAVRAGNMIRVLSNLHSASDRGDVKASLALLAASPLTKDDFAPTKRDSATPIQVILNIPRPERLDMTEVQATVIEHV